MLALWWIAFIALTGVLGLVVSHIIGRAYDYRVRWWR